MSVSSPGHTLTPEERTLRARNAAEARHALTEAERSDSRQRTRLETQLNFHLLRVRSISAQLATLDTREVGADA